MTAEAPFFELYQTALMVTAGGGEIPVTITGMPGSSGYSALRRGHHCPLGPDCRYHEVQDSHRGLTIAWTCQLRPAIKTATATPPAPERTITFAAPARRGIRHAKAKHPMTPVRRSYLRTHVGGPDSGTTRMECWSAVSTDGAWEYHRLDDTGTVWEVRNVPLDLKIARAFGCLNSARAETYRITAARIQPARELATA